jgi:1,4-alpha-glucan branching enzyme
MVTKDSAAGYARDRHARHHAEARRLADLLERGDLAAATAYADELHRVDGPFGSLDARLLTRLL